MIPKISKSRNPFIVYRKCRTTFVLRLLRGFEFKTTERLARQVTHCGIEKQEVIRDHFITVWTAISLYRCYS